MSANWWEIGKPAQDFEPVSATDKEERNWWEIGQPVEELSKAEAVPVQPEQTQSPIGLGPLGLLVESVRSMKADAQGQQTVNPILGATGRGAELLGSALETTARLGQVAPDTLSPIAPAAAAIQSVAPKLQEWADSFRNWGQEINYAPSTQLKELADNPAKVVPFVIERVITSSPDMAAAYAALPAYIPTRANEILNQRLKNDGRSLNEATIGDVAASTAAATVEGTLERFATRQLGVTEGILRPTAVQAGTEAIEEVGAYAGEVAGTKAGFSPEQAGLIALEAGIVGGGLGGVAATGTELVRRNIESQVRDLEGVGTEIEKRELQKLRDQAFKDAQTISAPELPEVTPLQYGDAYAQKIYDSVGQYIPINAEFKVEEKVVDGAPRFVITDKEGTQYGQTLQDQAQAESLALSLNNTTQSRAELIKQLEPLQSSLIDTLRGFGLNDVGLTLSDRIFTRRGEALTSEGLFDPVVRRVFLAVDAIDPQGTLDAPQRREALRGVLRHEVVHALRYLDLWKRSEWKNLEQTVGKLTKPGTDKTYLQVAQENYADQSPVIQVEEAVADLIRDVAGNISRVAGRPRSLSERAINFFDKAKNALTGAGFQTYEDIVQRFEQGDIGARERGRIRTFRATEEQQGERGQVPERLQRLFKNPQERIRFREEAVQRAENEIPDAPLPARNSIRLNAIREARSTVDSVPEMITIGTESFPTRDSEGRLIYSGYEGPEVFGIETKPTQEGLRNFWKWFGDSKAVDTVKRPNETDSGKRPVVYYHGTAADITEFRPKQAGAVFITRSPEFADLFAGLSSNYMIVNFPDFMNDQEVLNVLNESMRSSTTPRFYEKLKDVQKRVAGLVQAGRAIDAKSLKDIKELYGDKTGGLSSRMVDSIRKRLPSSANLMPVYVKAENPWDYENKDHFRSLIKEVRKQYGADLEVTQLDIDNIRDGDWVTIEGSPGNSPFLDAIKSLGFDSMFVKEAGVKNLAVFNPNQIKSAIGNNGDFSPITPNIREAREKPTYNIVNSRTGEVVGQANTINGARRSVDRRDNQYGASVHTIQVIDQEADRLQREKSRARLGIPAVDQAEQFPLVGDTLGVTDEQQRQAQLRRVDEAGAGRVRSERAGDRGGRDQGRVFAPLEGAPNVQGAGPIPEIVVAAEQYAAQKGIPYERQPSYVEVDVELAKRIANAFEEMRHDPKDPVVAKAYNALIKQTRDQYDALINAGYTFTFFDSATDPYGGNPWNAMRDLRNNKRMAVYGTYDGYGTAGITDSELENNPMLQDTGLRWPDQNGIERMVTANDLFRAVHDAFGHGIEGAGFRARGEENAWQAHARLFTGLALGALTTETRGQNSWLNYGPYGEKNRTAKLEDTVFAEQKTGLMPEWTWQEGFGRISYGTAEPAEAIIPRAKESRRIRSLESTLRPRRGGGVTLSRNRQADATSTVGIHYGNVEGLNTLSSRRYGEGIRGVERTRVTDRFADPRLKKRVYFYINYEGAGKNSDGKLPLPEVGLSNNLYSQQFDNILFPGPRMLALAEQAAQRADREQMSFYEQNYFESAVIDAGYDGYASPDKGMMVILNHDAPVDFEGVVEGTGKKAKIIRPTQGAIIPRGREARPDEGTPIGPTQPGPTNDADGTSAAEALNNGQPVDPIGIPSGPTILDTEPDGTVNISGARIAPLTQRLVIQMIQSAPDKLRAGFGLDDLAKRIENYYDAYASRLGLVNGIIRGAFKRIGIRGERAALETFEEFIRARENNRTEEAQAILDEATDSERQLIDAWNQIAVQTGEINTGLRTPDGKPMRVWDAKRGEWRPIRSVKNFFPRTFRREVMEVMQNPDLDPVLWQSLLDSLVAANRAETTQDAEKYLLREWFSDEVTQDYFAGVEKARTDPLPEIFYDYSWDAATRYLRKWSRRTAQIENFGQTLGKFQKEWFDENIPRIRDPETQNYLNAIKERIYEIEQFNALTNMASWGNSLATATQLGNPVSASLNLLGGTVANVQEFGIKQISRSYIDLVRDWKNVQQEGTTLGILNTDFMNILNDHVEMDADKYFSKEQKISQALAKFTNVMLTVGGFNGAENIVRSAAMLAARARLNQFLSEVNEGTETNAVKRFREWVKRENLDIDALILEDGAGKETERYMRRAVNVPQGSYNIDMTPVFIDTAAGRFLLKYQKFGTQINRFFYNQFLKPIVTEKDRRGRNIIRALGFVGTAIIGGGAIIAIREAFGYGDPGPDLDELDKALIDNEDIATAWSLLLSRAWQNIMAAGSLGFFANYAQFAKDWQDQQRVKNPFSPPGLASVDAVIDVFNRLRDQKKLTGRDLDEIAETTLSFYRANKRITLAAMDAIGSDAREVRRFAAQKEVREVREYGRRYSEAMEIEFKRRTSPGAPIRTPMTPTNKAITDALLQGDSARARLLIRESIRGLRPKDRERVMASIRASVRNRQPIQIGGSAPSQQELQAFMRWSRQNLPAEKYQMIRRADRRYKLAASRAGIGFGG